MEEFGREVYKLFKLFNAKAKQIAKERDKEAGDNLGGVTRGKKAVSEGAEETQEQEFAPVKMSRSVQDQIKGFKVHSQCDYIHVVELNISQLHEY